MLSSNNLNITYDGYYFTITKNNSSFKIQNVKIYDLSDEIVSILSISEIYQLFISAFGLPNDCSRFLIRKVKLYLDNIIKKFSYLDKEYWIDKETRNSIINLLNYNSEDTFDLILGEEIIQIPTESAKSFFRDLELFASNCKLILTRMIKEIESMLEVEDLINYDYESKFPTKLNLEDYIQ